MNIGNTFGYQFEKVEKCGNATLLHMINKTGYGSLTYRNILPGIELTYDQIHMESFWKKLEREEGTVLQINHCLRGQFSFTMDNGKVYGMNAGDFCIYDRSCGEIVKSEIPGKLYQGFSVQVRPEEIKGLTESCGMSEELDFSVWRKKIAREGGPVLLKSFSVPARVTDEIYFVEHCDKNSLYLLKIMELLLSISDFFRERKECLFKYSWEMLDAVRRIHDRMLSEPLREMAMQELCKEFLLPKTGFIQCFKECYGMPPAAFMRAMKMKYAAKEMLRCPWMSIREIATLVGYDNQSKFAAAFKAQWGLTPLAYKKMNFTEEQTE